MQQSIKIPRSTRAKSRRKDDTVFKKILTTQIFTFKRKELPDKKKEIFFSEVGIMLSSGVDIHAALKIVGSDFQAKADAAIFSRLIDGLISGENLSDAMLGTNAFSRLDISVTRIGESTGQIVNVFKFLADYYNRKLKQRTLVLNSISYPSFVLFFAVIAVGFLLNSVVPIFSSIYKRFGGDLPFITRFVVSISDRMWLITLIFLLAVSALVFLSYLYRTSIRFNMHISKALLAMPFINQLLVVNFMERFCRVMAMLTSSKIPLVESVNLSKETVTLLPYREALGRVEADLYAGVPFWRALERTQHFSRRIIYLVKMGEEVNRLEAVFENLTVQYGIIQEKRLKNLGTYLEPVLIVIVGIMVGFILISVYLPMFKLGDKFM